MTMKLSHEGLRKAAILVANLDMAAADAVLEQLTAEQARQVRQLVVELDEIDQGEQRRVIDEFVGPKAPAEADHEYMAPAGVELDGRLAWLASRGGGAADEADRPAATGHPFRFLQETEAEKLVRLLGSERPQTIALVLSNLPPVRAAAVLTRLAENVQVEVVRRLVDLEETDPEILREVEEALRSRLAQQIEMPRRRVAGLQAAAEILQAVEGRAGARILGRLADRDGVLAEKLGPPQLAFDDLAGLDRQAIAEVFEEAGPELILPALFGAAPQLVNRLLAGVPPADARAIRHALDHPDPIRLSDVEEARRQVARIASRWNHRAPPSAARAA